MPAANHQVGGAGHVRDRARHVDALATVRPDGEADDGQLYGESSTIAFVRAVTRQGQRGTHTPVQRLPSIHAALGPGSGLSRLDLSLGRKHAKASVPLRRNADDYLHCYWEYVHPLFPVLHRPTFEQKYARLWMPESIDRLEDDGDLLFMPDLNLVFALGCQFSSLVPPDEKSLVANDFYESSRSVLLFDVLGSTSPGVVQWLLLSGIYLQSTRHASHCWNSIGLAVRLAQSLGLHLENGRHAVNQVEREMKRRIWHSCVVLDR